MRYSGGQDQGDTVDRSPVAPLIHDIREDAGNCQDFVVVKCLREQNKVAHDSWLVSWERVVFLFRSFLSVFRIWC